MHVIPLYSTNRAFSHVKLSEAHKQADIHNLKPEVTLQNDLTPTHSSTPWMFFHSLCFTDKPTRGKLFGLKDRLSV